MKDPAFLFYPQDFLVGTMTMSFEDRGKYITILCLMHQQGKMDEKTISFLVGSVSDMLRLKFKQDENGLWYNERLETEKEKRINFVESRRNNGKLGGRPKNGNNKIKANGKPNAKAKNNLPLNINGNINEDVILIPSFAEFSKYAIEKKPDIDINNLKLKYDSWVENKWMDGNDKKISNWKTKLLNTLPYIKIEVKNGNKEESGVSIEYKESILRRLHNNKDSK